MTTSPDSRNRSPQSQGTYPHYLITWKEPHLRKPIRTVPTEPWWTNPVLMVVSALVTAGVLYFAHALFSLSGALFVGASTVVGIVLNRIVTKTSPSIVAIYPNYLKQNRGQSTLKIEFTSVAHCRWSVTPELTILEFVGKENWVLPVALRKSTPMDKVQAALERVGVEVKAA